MFALHESHGFSTATGWNICCECGGGRMFFSAFLHFTLHFTTWPCNKKCEGAKVHDHLWVVRCLTEAGFYSGLLNTQYRNLTMQSCQRRSMRRPNISHGLRISFCLLLGGNVQSRIREVGGRRRRRRRGFMPLMCNLLKMDLQVWRDKGRIWSWKCLRPMTWNREEKSGRESQWNYTQCELKMSPFIYH